MGRMMNKCPEPVVVTPLLQSLLKCAVVGMQLDHKGANKGTLRFLEDTISFGLSLRELNKPECLAALEGALSQEGQPIVVNLTRAMVGELPAYSERQIPEILWKLNLLCPSFLSQWLIAAFNGVDRLPERAKVDFMGALSTGLAKDEFSLAVRAFQTACHREHRFRPTPQHSYS
jgi:transportin-3